MTDEVEDTKSELERFMEDDSIPSNSEEVLTGTQKLRWGLIKKHLKDTDDPQMLARVDSLANGIDKQELTKMRLAQDKEEGAANRDIANEIFQKMLKEGVRPQSSCVQPEIESSGIEILDDELIQGDDTLNSVID